jgi:hypothetical protein
LHDSKGEEASSLVEYAVIMTMLFMLLFGIAGFAEAINSYHFVAHAAREATRWASLNGSTCVGDESCGSPAGAGDGQTYVNNLVPTGIDGSKVTVNATWPSTSGVCASTDKRTGLSDRGSGELPVQFRLPAHQGQPTHSPKLFGNDHRSRSENGSSTWLNRM